VIERGKTVGGRGAISVNMERQRDGGDRFM
jgi:hypothetical protein